MIKTIEELHEDLQYALIEIHAAKDASIYHHGEASKADGEVVKWAAEVRAAEEAIIAASGESS